MTMFVRFLAARSLRPHYFTYPLRAFSNQLAWRGIKVAISHNFDSRLLKPCDVLCIVSRDLNMPSDDLINAIGLYRKKADRIILMDCNDSTGTIWTALLSHVDVYAKSQLLADRTLYQQAHYRKRYFTDYYYRNYGIQDEPPIQWSQPIAPEHQEKLTLSWNLGLRNWNHPRLGRLTSDFVHIWPRAVYRVKPVSPTALRTIDVSCRATSKQYAPTVRYQREETLKHLLHLSQSMGLKVASEGKLPYSEYIAEIRRALFVASPFGWGEICYRDFEAFINGAVLLKPDMSLVETWPPYYESFKTYVPHAWDFSDFPARVMQMLNSPDQLLEIAQNAQQRFLMSISTEGGEQFAAHFATLLDFAMKRSTIKP